MPDFTLSTYQKLLKTLISRGFSFLTFEEMGNNSIDNVIVLRHDVDALPENSLQFARIEAEKGIKGTYYFRVVQNSFDENIICEIASLGHEIGYHYEDMGAMAQTTFAKASVFKGHEGATAEEKLAELAIISFKGNLTKLRQLVPVKTICMHGNPMSRWDSRLLWKYYDYHDFGIVGEPYFDTDFNEVMYLTDTGRRWNGDAVNIRDKAEGNPAPFQKFHSTSDIIKAANQGLLPDKIMITFHPQRWTDKPVLWVKELVWQNVKNVGKYLIIKTRIK